MNVFTESQQKVLIDVFPVGVLKVALAFKMHIIPWKIYISH